MEEATIIEANESALVQIVKESGLEQTKAKSLIDNFLPYFQIVSEWEGKINAIVTKDAPDKVEMKIARECRLFVKSKRVLLEKARKQLGESALREKQTIDLVARKITDLIEPLETKAEYIEKYEERQEQARRAQLKIEREAECAPYSEFIPQPYDLGQMSDDAYAKLLNGAKLQQQEKARIAFEEEKERKQREQDEEASRELQRLENERLKAEKELAEKKLAEERLKADTERKAQDEKNRKEREEADRVRAEEKRIADEALRVEQEDKALMQAELKRKQDAEDKLKRDADTKLKEQQGAERKAAAAPDRNKLITLADTLDAFPTPKFTTPEAAQILVDVKVLLSKVSKYIREKTEQL